MVLVSRSLSCRLPPYEMLSLPQSRNTGSDPLSSTPRLTSGNCGTATSLPYQLLKSRLEELHKVLTIVLEKCGLYRTVVDTKTMVLQIQFGCPIHSSSAESLLFFLSMIPCHIKQQTQPLLARSQTHPSPSSQTPLGSLQPRIVAGCARSQHHRMGSQRW